MLLLYSLRLMMTVPSRNSARISVSARITRRVTFPALMASASWLSDTSLFGALLLAKN